MSDYPHISGPEPRPEPATAFDREIERQVERLAREMGRQLYEATAERFGVPADSDIADRFPDLARSELVFGIGPPKPMLGLRAVIAATPVSEEEHELRRIDSYNEARVAWLDEQS